MPYCTKCGSALANDSRFCSNCGNAASSDGHTAGHRVEVWEGDVHKCPYCGEFINSFTGYCPACGNELRGRGAARSVAEFSRKLEAIEMQRISVESKKGFFKKAFDQNSVNEIDQQKISLIKTFPIPNNVEDIQEFVILAASNINANSYSSFQYDIQTLSSRAVSDAWLSKCEQSMQKAKLSFRNAGEVDEMQLVIDQAKDRIKRARRNGILKWAALFSPLPLLLLILLLAGLIGPAAAEADQARLEKIVSSIEQDIDDGEYLRALLNADSLESGASRDMQHEWEINRAYWVERVVSEAAKNGVDLTDKAPELNQADSVGDESGGFVKGFTEAVSAGSE